ncbi:sulfurtransferase complex subunit TusC [Celerinatantimonas yamalensis]|uniref:Sulfurtransferase complex subunit TusC n=1 Tax=Celerinatantimonas yamalensis TaxID=559956 RepID=A0ABW9G7P1_9GAMM
MSSMLFIMTHPPHGSSDAREGLDAILAASAVCDDIRVLFDADGVWQLCQGQQPEAILQRHIEPTYAMLELYDIEQLYVSKQALKQRHLDIDVLALAPQVVDTSQLKQLLHHSDIVLRF